MLLFIFSFCLSVAFLPFDQIHFAKGQSNCECQSTLHFFFPICSLSLSLSLSLSHRNLYFATIIFPVENSHIFHNSFFSFFVKTTFQVTCSTYLYFSSLSLSLSLSLSS